MSNSDRRSGNQPFRLQFGSGAAKKAEGEPKLAQPVDDVDDEFVFHNSAAIMRELREKKTALAQQKTPAPPPADPARTSRSDVDVVDNILDPNWEPDRAVAGREAAPVGPTQSPRLQERPARTEMPAEPEGPEPVPPMPVKRERIGEFGVVLPEHDTRGTKRGWAAYAGLAAGVVLAAGAVGGAYYQLRDATPAIEATPQVASTDPIVTTTAVTAKRLPAEDPAEPTAATGTSQPADLRRAPAAPEAPGRDAVASAPPPMPDRNPPETMGQVVPPVPAQPGLVADPTIAPQAPAQSDLPVRAGPGATTVAALTVEPLPARRSLIPLERPSLGDLAVSGAAATPGSGPDAQASHGDAKAQAPLTTGPLPRRAMQRPELTAPVLPFGTDPGPQVAKVATSALPAMPDAADAGALPVGGERTRALGRAPGVRATRPSTDRAELLAGTRLAPNLPQIQTSLDFATADAVALLPDVAPVRPAEPKGPTRRALSTPVLLAASAQFPASPASRRAGSNGYGATDLAAPDTPRAPAIAYAPGTLPASGGVPHSRVPPVTLASVVRPMAEPGLAASATPLVAAPVQDAIAAIAQPAPDSAPFVAGPRPGPGRPRPGPPLSASPVDSDPPAGWTEAPVAPLPVNAPALAPAIADSVPAGFAEMAPVAAARASGPGPSFQSLSQGKYRGDPAAAAPVGPVMTTLAGPALPDETEVVFSTLSPQTLPAIPAPATPVRSLPERAPSAGIIGMAPVAASAQLDADGGRAPAPDTAAATPLTTVAFGHWPDLPAGPAAGLPDYAALGDVGAIQRTVAMVLGSTPRPLAATAEQDAPTAPARLALHRPHLPPAGLVPGSRADTGDLQHGASDAPAPNQVSISRQPPVPLQTAMARAPDGGDRIARAATTPTRIGAEQAVSGAGQAIPDGKATSPALVFLAPAPEPTQAPRAAEGPKSRFVASASWITDIDLEMSDIGGAVTILSSTSGGPDWVRQGAVVRAIDGQPVASLQTLTEILHDRAASAANGRIELSLDIRTTEGAEVSDTIRLTAARQVRLTDGSVVELRRTGTKWAAVVRTSRQERADGIRDGDVLLFDFATRTKLAAPLSLEALLARLDAENATEVRLAIVRDDALETATLNLRP